MSGDGHQFLVKCGARHGHLSRHCLNREFGITDVFLDQGDGSLDKLLVERGDSDLAGFNVHLLAELLVVVLLPLNEFFHTEAQHFNIERLGEIVVGPQLQSFYATHIGGASRE